MYINNNVNLCIYILRIFLNIQVIITSKYKYSNIYKYNYCTNATFYFENIFSFYKCIKADTYII